MLYCGRDEPGHPSMLLHRVIGRRTEHDKKLHNYCGRRSSWRLPCLQRSTNAELTIYLIARPADSETRVDRRGRSATWTFRSFIIYDARYVCDWIYRTEGIALATSPPTPSSLDIYSSLLVLRWLTRRLVYCRMSPVYYFLKAPSPKAVPFLRVRRKFC